MLTRVKMHEQDGLAVDTLVKAENAARLHPWNLATR